MSDLSRRDLFRNVALSTALGGLSVEAAQHVHDIAKEDTQKAGGVYKPKALNEHEFATLKLLTNYIIPADSHSPGAVEAGAAEWIDLLSSENPEMLETYTGGLGWIDHASNKRYGKNFIEASADQQKALLDSIAYRKNDSPETGPGIAFFRFLRNMTVDAFYTSRIGIKDIQYLGNTGVAEFKVPQECYDWVINHSPFAKQS